jgi:hypothetical protein
MDVTRNGDDADTPSPLSAEMRILIAVVLQAIRDLDSPVAAHSAEARAWLDSGDCRWWCTVCDVPYTSVQRYVARHQAQDARPAGPRWWQSHR